MEGEMKYILKEGECEDEIKLINAFELLYSDYLKRIGIGEKYKILVETEKRLILTRCEFVETKNRKLLNKIDQLEAKIDNMKKSNGETTRPEIIIMYLSKFLGFKIDIKKDTTLEYFYWINEYKKQPHG
jgi:hypothetical protein